MTESSPRPSNKKVTSSVQDVAEEKPAFGSRYYGYLRLCLGPLKVCHIQVSDGRRRCMEPECLGPRPTSRRSTRKNHRIIIETTFETCTSGRKRKIQFKTCKTLVYLFWIFLYISTCIKSGKKIISFYFLGTISTRWTQAIFFEIVNGMMDFNWTVCSISSKPIGLGFTMNFQNL